ncbi:putative transcription antitermination protein NusB [Phycisphaera mikurensis NBRC 102666]|uniref:Putative transcription antitermination protein NusB n=1 Tax=Phycisphaera mikurensis (strain NBRC 102666 / KCTC 22515 / FYK2301M01) TaxID=1142394 RepID=I0IAB1_PHYMF|nr:putative transcription antitermination protein NusB [Phycisphaera mikurensis NBRC 102666]
MDPGSVRRLAVQALYLLGTEPDAPAARLLEALDEPFDDEDEPDGHAEQTDAAKEAAVALALAAWAGHQAADAAVVAQVPAWPTLRQPPVDRAILRLAHHELATRRAPPAVVLDEAVELAKAFGEDRTPGFVNAVLDAIARGASPGAAAAGDAAGPVRRGEKPPPAGAAEARRGQRERFRQRKAEMAAKVGPKRDAQELREERERQAAEAEARRAEPPAERGRDADPGPDAPADPWSAAAARRDA